jgi:hypothetical protein
LRFPIYREPGIGTKDKRTNVQDATAEGARERRCAQRQSSLSTDRLSGSSLYPFSFFDLGSSKAITSIIFYFKVEVEEETKSRIGSFYNGFVGYVVRDESVAFFFASFKSRTTARIVCQLRVVAGTPNSLSIWPR